MALNIRPPFHADEGFVAAKQMTFFGKHYQAGDPFDWRANGCSLRKLQQMFNARLVMAAPEPVAAAQPDLLPMAAAPEPVTASEPMPEVALTPKRPRGRPRKLGPNGTAETTPKRRRGRPPKSQPSRDQQAAVTP